MDLQRQHEMCQSHPYVPNFDPKEGRVDEWWVKVWDMMEKERGERPRILIKLVKMCCVLSHSQAWVERGFNISKMFATDRESLSLHSMKVLKTIHYEIKRQGGAEKVVITPTMLVQAKMTGREAREAIEKEQKRKEKKLATEALEMEAAKKRKADSHASKNWDSTKGDMELRAQEHSEIY
jgi:hypothetical protein